MICWRYSCTRTSQPYRRGIVPKGPIQGVFKEDGMKKTPQTYVLTLHSPTRSAPRIWTGRNLHQLRHCSAKRIGHVLEEMQEHLDDLRSSLAPTGFVGSHSLNRGR